jgi:hypothetical protein
MRTFIAVMVVVCFVMTPMPSFAAKGGKKGPDDKAYIKADENAKFKREGEVEGTEENQKKKRKRIETQEGEDKGKGEKERKRKRKPKEGEQDD